MNLRAIEIPAETTQIGIGAFKNCHGVKQLTLHEGLIEIGDYAFQMALDIDQLLLPESLKHVGHYGFSGAGIRHLTIPENIEYIGDYAFTVHMLPIDMPETLDRLEYMGNFAFSGTKLVSIGLGNGLKYFGESFARNCPFLERLTLPESYSGTFVLDLNGCANLRSLEIPASRDAAVLFLEGCTSLETLVINGDWSEGTFAGCKFSEIKSAIQTSPIRDRQFENCVNLTAYDIQQGVSEIGDAAFRGCLCLTRLSIPDSVTRIGSEAIPNTSELTEQNELIDIRHFTMVIPGTYFRGMFFVVDIMSVTGICAQRPGKHSHANT